MINTVAAKADLEAQLMELKERQDRIAQGLAEPLNPDFSEQAVPICGRSSSNTTASVTSPSVRNGGAHGCGLSPLIPIAWHLAQNSVTSDWP